MIIRLEKKFKLPRRLIAFLLCLCIVMSTVIGVGIMTAFAYFGPTQNIVEQSRKADPNTMDDYRKQLLSTAWGSRYAGRIWTDKSVFAYGADDKNGGVTGNEIKLDMRTDGYDGNVGFNADFAHVFSALASSQVINEWPPSPIDLVIVFDMSASMGQDTRYGLDGGTNDFTTHNASGDSQEWPAEGVLMSDRIENSRIQLTLNAINNTIDKLMAQNPENRVAVCCYGANAVVLLPLAHYTRQTGTTGEKLPYLKVGGMETLYHPGDLVWRDKGDSNAKEAGWYWINNRDTAYTVEAHAMKNDNVSSYSMKDLSDPTKYERYNKIISNNVKNPGVKAFPGVADPARINDVSLEIKQNSKTINISHDKYTARSESLKNAVAKTEELNADDYVGYFTNTQGGIYLAYKQLADSTATTYTDKLSDGKDNTVARIPAAIIMSDGGANFAFNNMGGTVDDWNKRYGAKKADSANNPTDVNSYYLTDNAYNAKEDDVNYTIRDEDYNHSLGGNEHGNPGNTGDEWYHVYLPGDDTLLPGVAGKTTADGKWDGLHTLYNLGADYYHDGTLQTPPVWDRPGVLYANDADWQGTPATVLEVLLTASYMKQVAMKHYEAGWEAGKASPDSQSTLSTYTMNVDTKDLPQWARWRLFPTLDPKNYPPDAITNKVNAEPKNFGSQYGNDAYASSHGDFFADAVAGNLDSEYVRATVFDAIEREWNALKDNHVTNLYVFLKGGASAGGGVAAKLDMTDPSKYVYDGKIAVSADEILDHIAYNDEFTDVTFGELDTTFDRILSEITGNVFTPISGSNDAGVGDSITYQDPLGEYMEIKNQSITAQTHKDSAANTYDMALLLFGEMHGLVRAGVYDWNWNDRYMRAHSGEYTVGKDPFPMGWYRGDDPTNAETPQKTDKDEAGTYPTESKEGETYQSAAEARAAGWVFRLDYKTLLQFVPITGVDDTDPNFHPSSLPAQVKNTVYTCYRFAGSQEERNKLRRNPIFGNEIPEKVQKEWDDFYANENKYPDDNKIYAKTPGVYRISDIRVWVEDTGDFIDTDGAIAPNAGYDRSLYLNVPAAAVPTQLATVTLGQDGVLSYETNLGDDHPEGGTMNDKVLTKEQYYAQSTPLRLFYAVGLEDDLLLKEGDNQKGVDFTKISAEYIEKHTVAGQDYVWFISNYYSNTTYDEYVTDSSTYRTRGDPTVTFSPSVDNRYYVFQKPLPLYAHAYRLSDGTLKPVDDKNHNGNWTETDNQNGGNGSTEWENATDNTKGGGLWTGGEFMGTYTDENEFNKAKERALVDDDGYITDSSGTKYKYIDNGIVFLERDLLDRVTSNDEGGYTNDSVSFSSNDYFFILVEYYLPDVNTVGKDINNNKITGSYGGRMVQYVVARRGSEFGSAFASDKIDNGDMLCWTDMNGHITKELAYLSKTDTGDKTRGEPTLKKLTLKGEALKKYLKDCGIEDVKTQYDYWIGIQNDEGVKAALEKAAEHYGLSAISQLTETQFQEYFKFAVAARPGGIRTGDMSNNIHTKGDKIDPATGYYENNLTKTANNYYVPTVSDNSATDNGVILNTYLGNNGYLEIANQMLHVTKMLEAPEGFELTDEAKNEEFNYQIYVQGVTGKRTAALTQYNEYAKTWERQLAYIDVLTDNSDLVLDNDSHRAVFIEEEFEGSTDETLTAKMVIANGTDDDGNPIYYVANEDGTLTFNEDGTTVNVKVNKKVEQDETLYYMYLPPNSKSTDLTAHSRRLYQNKSYNGTADGYDGTYDNIFSKNGTTTFFAEGQRAPTGTSPGAGNRDSYRKTTDLTNRPAGTRTYWAQDAELIPKDSVDEFEKPSEEPGGTELTSVNVWTHAADAENHDSKHIDLAYFTFVIRKPNDETSETNFSSPFKTRSLYLTKEIEFGVNANENDGDGKKGKDLKAGDLYDSIIPSADRPDLFGNVKKSDGTEVAIDNAYIAEHTAEFTLKHGEGLLLSGLDNRITYRFTEKLTNEQLKAGYTLKRISHIQQRGSESIYLPGVQKIPIYTKTGSTYGLEYGTQAQGKAIENNLTWKWNSTGVKNAGTTENQEPFAHTNAIMWEYYATMAAGASGNHHQPSNVTTENKEAEKSIQVWDESTPNKYDTIEEPHIVKDNPSCQDAGSVDGLALGKCDVKQGDSILHYMYYQGKLIDPHYEGEASTYLRNMARYGVSPTVHFGVNGEEVMTDDLKAVPSTILEHQASRDKEYYDYNGVYSVYGNTGWFEEQANFVNTVDPDMLVVTKEVVDKNDNHVAPTPDMVFSYTLELPNIAYETNTIPALTDYSTVYLWRGSKDTMTSALKWTDESVPKQEYTMPATAPNLDEYREFIPTADSPTEGKTYLQPVTLEKAADGKRTYKFKLKADEAVVFYGIPAGTDYTVTETVNPNYPIHPKYKTDDPYSEAGNYAQTGEVLHYRETSLDTSRTVNRTAMRAKDTDNRENYYNEMSTGMLTVEKKIQGDEPDTKKKFTFTVTLTAGAEGTLNSSELTVTKFTKTAEGTETSEDITKSVSWNSTVVDGKTVLTAEITLKHGERFVIGGIPIDTKYTVKETGRAGYNLQHVADNTADSPGGDGNYLTLENDSVTGTITTEKAQVYLLFVNEKAPFLPFVGGMGVVAIVLIGVLLIGLATALIVQKKYRRRRNA